MRTVRPYGPSSSGPDVVERSNRVCTTPNARAPRRRDRPLANTTSASSAALRSLDAVADEHVELPAVARVLDRRLLAHSARRARAAAVLVRELQLARREVDGVGEHVDAERRARVLARRSRTRRTRPSPRRRRPAAPRPTARSRGRAAPPPRPHGARPPTPSTSCPLVDRHSRLPISPRSNCSCSCHHSCRRGTRSSSVHADVDGADGAVEVEEHRCAREIEVGSRHHAEVSRDPRGGRRRMSPSIRFERGAPP